MNGKGMLAGLVALAGGFGELPQDRMKHVEVSGNFSGSHTPANLKKNRKKPVTMRRPKSKKRKH